MTGREGGARLGRGLAALLGDINPPQPTAAAAPGVRDIAIELFEPSPFQPRGTIDAGALAELAQSIKDRGILQPVLARPHPTVSGRYQLIAGERRWRAAQEAGLHEIPALVRALPDTDAMAAALVENLQRQDLNAIEEAEGYRRLLDEFAMTHDRLAQAVGKSRSHISNTMRLLNLPPSVQGEVRNGALSAGHARALLAHPEPAKAALAVVARGLSVRQTEALASAKAETSPRPERRAKEPETESLERELSERLGLKVEIQFDGTGGSVRIRYRGLDQLDAIIALLSAS